MRSPDAILARAVLLALAILACIALAPRDCQAACDPVDGPRRSWTPQERHETRARVRAACEALGAAPIVCAYADLVVVRESSGRASIRHTLGENEYGVGAMGLDIRAHADKWPGEPDPDWCTPEASLVVAHEVWWRAVDRWGAASIPGIQAIYGAGHGVCTASRPAWWRHVPGLAWLLRYVPRRSCRPGPPRHRDRLCSRLRARGHSCAATVGPGDLGERLPYEARRAWAMERARRWTGKG